MDIVEERTGYLGASMRDPSDSRAWHVARTQAIVRAVMEVQEAAPWRSAPHPRAAIYGNDVAGLVVEEVGPAGPADDARRVTLHPRLIGDAEILGADPVVMARSMLRLVCAIDEAWSGDRAMESLLGGLVAVVSMPGAQTGPGEPVLRARLHRVAGMTILAEGVDIVPQRALDAPARDLRIALAGLVRRPGDESREDVRIALRAVVRP